MKQVIVITGASSGFGALAARALAHAGHTVYASMRETTGRNAPQVAEVARYAAEHKVDLRSVKLDVASDQSAQAGIAKIIGDNGRLDVVIHNAGHMSFGPAEAFTPEQFAQLYDVNVLSTQRVNRAAAAQTGPRSGGLGILEQRARRHTALSLAVFRSQGGDGLACSVLRRRTGALGHRDLDHRARRLHQGHQSFCAFRQTGGRRARCRIRQRPLCRGAGCRIWR